jgi:hypothetical protein
LLEHDRLVSQRVDGDNPIEAHRIIDTYNDTDNIPDPMETEAVQGEADDYTDKANDQLISAQVILPVGLQSDSQWEKA